MTISVFTPRGQFVHRYDTAYTVNSQSVTIDSFGHSLVTSYNNNRIRVFDTHGRFVSSFETLHNFPSGVAVSPDGAVWVVFALTNTIVKY